VSEKPSILDQIAQDARVLRKARMLPTDRPLTPEEIDSVARRFKDWLRESKLSQSAVGRMLGKGFGASTLNHFVNGNKRGDQEKVARAVNELMERHTQAREVARPADFVEIETAKRMLAVIKTAVDTLSMAEIVGASGMGKTKVLKAANMMYAGSLYLRIDASSRSPMGFIRALCEEAGVPFRSSGGMTLRRLIEALSGTGRPIFIDELHQARFPTLEAIRDIYDKTKCPIILCGTEPLTKMIADRTRFFGQFNRRIVARFNIDQWMREPKGRGRPLFTAEEIKQIFSNDKVRLTDDGADFLSGIACLPNEGGLGLVENIVYLAGRLAKFKGQPLNAKILMAVLREMHGAAYTTLVEQTAERLHIRLATGTA